MVFFMSWNSLPVSRIPFPGQTVASPASVKSPKAIKKPE
jgi:hypothetical protein